MRYLITAAILAALAGPALAQAPAQPTAPASPTAPAIDQRAIDAARALSAYERGVTMQRNAAERLCALGQTTHCGAAGAPTTAQGQTAPAPTTPGNQGSPARR